MEFRIEGTNAEGRRSIRSRRQRTWDYRISHFSLGSITAVNPCHQAKYSLFTGGREIEWNTLRCQRRHCERKGSLRDETIQLIVDFIAQCPGSCSRSVVTSYHVRLQQFIGVENVARFRGQIDQDAGFERCSWSVIRQVALFELDVINQKVVARWPRRLDVNLIIAGRIFQKVTRHA